MVFQSYALYPHMRVTRTWVPAQACALREAEIESKVKEAANMLGLSELLTESPDSSPVVSVSVSRWDGRSSGPAGLPAGRAPVQPRRRVAVQTRVNLQRLHRDLATTFIYVTHDQTEAMTMGDRIAVLSDGVLQQVAPPREIYEHPANVFVAGFIGNPRMNLLSGELDPTVGARVVRVQTGTVPVPARVAANRAVGATVGSARVPEHRPQGTFTATVSIVELLGAEVHVVCRVGESRLVVRQEMTRAAPVARRDHHAAGRPRRRARLRRRVRQPRFADAAL